MVPALGIRGACSVVASLLQTLQRKHDNGFYQRPLTTIHTPSPFTIAPILRMHNVVLNPYDTRLPVTDSVALDHCGNSAELVNMTEFVE